MTILAGCLGVLFLLGLSLLAFVRTDAAVLARRLRFAVPAAASLCGLGLLAAGIAAPGGVLFAAGLILFAAAARDPKAPPARRHATVRTAALEMELDHRTGKLEGLVLAGTFEGKVLGRLQWPQLRRLHAELKPDAESCLLLEAYLDGRFPAWRKDAHPYVHGGKGVAPSAGAMTKEEAYKVLGLETGAGAADVRKAHRRLMQRLNPGIGGAALLAARINEAKDVLLSDHG